MKQVESFSSLSTKSTNGHMQQFHGSAEEETDSMMGRFQPETFKKQRLNLASPQDSNRKGHKPQTFS